MTRLPEAALLLLVGAMLGPDGFGILSDAMLAILDPAAAVALVALGMAVGLRATVQSRRDSRLFAAATSEAAVTGALVTAGLLLTMSFDGAPSAFVAVALGVCAAPSAAAVRRPGDGQTIVERLGDLNALLPIALGGVALAWTRTASPPDALLLALQACGVACVMTAAAWLLVGRAVSETEQRVFTVALLLLLAGAADYLSLSALLSGLVAGLFLERAGGPARDAIGHDVLQFERPLLALVLLIAGAEVELSLAWLALGLVLLLLRTVAKLAGGWVSARMAGAGTPWQLGAGLLSPGVLGLAFALNALRAGGPEGGIVLAAAVVGMIGSELLATLIRPPETA